MLTAIKKTAVIFLTAGLFSGWLSSGFAADTNQFNIAPGEQYTVIVPTSDIVELQKFVVDFFYTYADRPLKLEIGGTDEDLVKEQHLFNVGITCGINERMQVSLVVPYVANQSSESGGVPENGMCDIFLSGKYRFDYKPNVSFAIAPYLQLPTGDEDAFTGTAADIAGGVRGIVSARAGENLHFTFNIGYAYQEIEELVQVKIEHSLLFGAGVTYIFPNLTTFISGEVYGRSEELFDFESEETPVEGIVSLGYRGENTSLVVGGGIGLVDGYGASGWRVFTGLRLGL